MNTHPNRSKAPLPPEDIANLRDALYTFFSDFELHLEQPLDDDTPLISSGVLDSLAVFNLVIWVEQKIGQSVDPATTDLAREWNTLGQILAFIRKSYPQKKPQNQSDNGSQSVRRMRGLRIVEYSPGYAGAIAELQTRLWSTDIDRNGAYLKWKYEANPYGNEPHIYLALDNGEVVAMRGFYPSQWEIGARRQRRFMCVADDLVVRNDHRGKGLVNHLMRTAYDSLNRRGIDYLLNLSGSDFTQQSALATGWESAGDMNPIHRCSPSLRRLNRLRRAFKGVAMLWRMADSPLLSTGSQRRPFARLDALPRALVCGDGVTVNVSDLPMAFKMADLVERTTKDHRIRHVRDEAYFDWRFNNPLNNYRFVYVGQPDLDGYLVLKCHIDGTTSPRVSIVDLEAVDDRTHDAMLECVTRQDLFEELFAWSATLPERSRVVLSLAGFGAPDHAGQATRRVIIRPTDDAQLTQDWEIDGIRILDFDNWDMRMLYSMAG